MPVLEGILISAEQGKITLISYNLEMGMKKEIYAKCDEAGDIVINARLLADIFLMIAEEKHLQSQMVSYYKELEKCYAKSYMQKKTITQKAKQAMEKSRFNQYFGYVEFDVETDLSLVEEIAKEVIRGNWGNGQERKDKLAAAGYNYDEVQAKVNELLK